jgi:hypothetical protein
MYDSNICAAAERMEKIYFLDLDGSSPYEIVG